MNRRFVAAGVVAAAAAAALWQTDAGAAAKRPVALQYDEIVRVALAPGTPPPPGAFQTDFATIMSGVSTSNATVPASTPTPAPRKHGLFGAITQVLTNGTIPGSDESGGSSYADQAMNAMKRMQEGNLVRYTFYKNWLRTDDPVNRTATISKCDIHQFISLDLAKKTYSLSNTAPACDTTKAAPYAGPRGQVVENLAPGAGDITITASATNLGPKTLDGIPTTGWDRSIGYAETNSTGSCKDSSVSMKTLAYVSQIVPPRRYCPLPHTSYAPSSAESVIVHGGCKPRMHGSMSGLAASSNRLEMYLKMTMAMDQSRGPGGFASVTERGNVKWFEQPAADALFSVPPGFTKQ